MSETRYGVLRMTGWHEYTETRVEVIGTTPKRLRIRAIVETRLPGRILSPGDVALVPKSAVRIECSGADARTERGGV